MPGRSPYPQGVATLSEDHVEDPFPPVLGLIGGDLMVRSRIVAVTRDRGWRIRDIRAPQDAAGCALVLVDLNAAREERLLRLQEAIPVLPREVLVLAFGPHVDASAWRPAARRAGAGTCTVNRRVAAVLRGRLAELATTR